ncbi:3-oxoacyl-ACP synthase III family protein [Polymorphospora rubra]|uniref:3-oxoacyl-[acyl-carrier-protein] synthase 3 n=1 Tax=Polymorphospora rubra TaxID=338584 RepID=A0A810N605_9ACTN|nr:beta-ketoacyl-ACP synthase 3 [Polymorphospora rubra]BCJ68836.1 3-oxoacyl-[acyl-carrier-protein] synthase 3 [Polymorphospora rubra]
MSTSTVIGTGSYLPRRVLSSGELARRVGVEENWIVERTGIRERRVAADEEATSDLATRAARRALRTARLDPADVDLIVLATSTPDRPMPATASTVQANLGARQAVAFDVDAVCSGFVYALVVAHSMLNSEGWARTALVIGADTYSRVLDYTDRRTAVLFGDGAGAVVLGRETGGGSGIRATALGTDGTLADLVQIPAGGSRRPASAQTVEAGDHYFAMRGGDVRRLANQVFPALVGQLLKAASLDLDQVDLIAAHQANGTMLTDWSRDLGLRPGVLHRTVERYGNTGAASVPVTLDDAVRTGRLGAAATLLMVAFGGGMTWGGVALDWSADPSVPRSNCVR